MQKQYIREILMSGRWRAYTIIIETYISEIEELKPALFKMWLAKELEMDESKINVNSLYSALKRRRENQLKKQQKGSENINKCRDKNQSTSSFIFSNPDVIEKISRLTEQ
ncbi:MAG: hypothetical protein JNM71_03960 [Flavobacterium lindanitolerans]|uniref:hypothetical protein n=1 Tax=Flavobacterium lindanitolerans TaxID=428988 RepID=UPI001A6129C5|nr:hypothetical protein [Flavobacterium lindanitolerans]MBL7867154.1 hypothetical protein [Flavobacterium lindanitolerans]